jgi:hypothetical protein
MRTIYDTCVLCGHKVLIEPVDGIVLTAIKYRFKIVCRDCLKGLNQEVVALDKLGDEVNGKEQKENRKNG